MGIFDKIFITEDKKEVVETKIPPPSRQPEVVRSTQTNFVTDESERQKYRDYFSKLFDDSNLPAPDYYEFRKALDKLSSFEEKLAFQACFASFAGLKKEYLLSTIDQYMKILQKNKNEFESTVNSSDVLQKNLDILTKGDKLIQDYKDKIAQIEKDMEGAKSSAEAEKTRLEQAAQNYEAEWNSWIELLEGDKQKIVNFL